MQSSRFFLALAAIVVPVALAASCGESTGVAQFNDADASLDGTGQGLDTGGGFQDDGGPSASCTPKTCAQLGFECGPQGDGCGAVIECGGCPSGQFCGGGGASKCGDGTRDGGLPVCTPKSCAELGARCGQQGDGCGNVIDCGACASPAYCGGGGSNACGLGGPDGGSNCTPKTCGQLNASCGVQGDGCGNVLNCGTCAAPAYCGGAGTNKCGQGGADGGSPCTPKTCAQLNARCGQQGDGCGGTVDCGGCTAPAFCGGGGTNTCGQGGTDGGSTCVPKTCSQLGAGCGIQGDGCGGTVNCGSCTSPAFCGGNGVNQCGLGGVDGGSPCVPKTCGQLGANCGTQGDGCGNPLNCGACAAPAYCGGGGVNQCGLGGADGGSPCVPKTCAQLGASCGTQGDGCGNTISCGACTAPAFCGGGGPNVCGQGGADGGAVCTPRSCAQQNANCGRVGDGCGGLTPLCGTCTAPQICGGSNPNQCGTGTITTDAGVFVTCDGGGVTSISGVVVAGTQGAFLSPGGPDPIYNAYVYVPSGPVQGITTGATCDKCSTPQSAIVSAITGVDGKFKLVNPPVGPNVPLVIQLGKWRRQITVNVTACQDNALTTAQTHLPRNRSEGNIPRFAVSTGAVDTLECVLRKMGIDDAEFTNPGISGGVPTSPGRVHVFQALPNSDTPPAGGAIIDDTTPSETALVGSATAINSYDIVLFPCIGGPVNKTAGPLGNIVNYANLGGRVFATHYSYVWLATNAPLDSTAVWTPDLNNYGGVNFTGFIDTSFPKGTALSQWLQLVAGGTAGQIPVNNPRNDFASVVAPGQRWMYATNPPDNLQNGADGGPLGAIPLHYTFNTPVDAGVNACGRVVFSDFHVENAGNSHNQIFPAECNGNTPMTPQEKLLEFMLFDLSSCISQDVPTCTPKTCAQLGANCGQQGDGCGGILQCGTCGAGDTCGGGGTPSVCGRVSCAPKTCAQLGLNCGPAGDGCGGVLQCGTCSGTNTCGGGGTGGVCGQKTCTPITCAQAGVSCGPAGDGCGGVLQCGACTGGNTCGGGGVPGQCGTAGCTPKTCAQVGVSCGPAGDGCGGLLSCGACSGTNTCGGGGSPGVCGSGSCAPLTCAQQGIRCGPAGDGCGNLLNCGPCTAPQTCGGGGTSGVCGNPVCTKLTCAQQNIRCGPAGDGCGGQIDCGPCVAPDTCGGAGTPGVCGRAACTPKTCAQQNITCGPAGDGCGNLLACGPCTSPDTCGGGGVSGQCGHPSCVPLTCAQQNISCGPAGDGCGGALDCGTCTAPQTCGGGGVAGKCGGTGTVK